MIFEIFVTAVDNNNDDDDDDNDDDRLGVDAM
jgi:hypothetical protein